ncbi:TPA: excinuclease ABC subunit C [bacterium]|nr:excinuclease ABC subunit C [bacterium]
MLKQKISLLSEKPGCYLMKDEKGKIIYIGKAKNLKKRVSQYFVKAHDGKTAMMVSKVRDFDTIITKSEKEALLLEANLVKKHSPRYNVLLKDDKRYPYVKLATNGYPTLEIARTTKDKNAKYFGPFSNSTAAYKSIDLLNYIFPLKKCKSNSKEPCFYYHLDMCLGYCFKEVSEEEYLPYVDKVIEFYNGETGYVRSKVVERMEKAAAKLEFEEASKYKTMLEYIDYLTIKQNVELNKNESIDFFSAHFNEGYLAIVTFIYRNGLLISKESKSFELIGEMAENFESYIIAYYQNRLKPKEIIVPEYLDSELLGETLEIKVSNAKIGKKKEILDMVGENAIKELQIEFAKAKDTKKILSELTSMLGIKSANIIELYDISHLAGEAAVGVKVAYQNGLPNKNLYRKYLIKGEEKKDDLASTREVLYRRLFRIISEDDYKPDLIILDGGLNQLNIARELLSELNLDIDFCALVKNNKHVTRGLINAKGEEIKLDKKSALFYFLVNMQEEVHRFAIKSHINKRSKSLTASILDDIKGLGKKRKAVLLSAFGSLAEIRKARVEELSQYIPKNVAYSLLETLNKDSKE